MQRWQHKGFTFQNEAEADVGTLQFELHEFGFTLYRSSKLHVPGLKSFQKHGVHIGKMFIVLVDTWSQQL
jgi:hypothetical protein